MKPIPAPRWLSIYHWVAGCCDVVTGMLLIFAPRWTLAHLGVRLVPKPIECVSFIGVFVLSTGAAYLSAFARPWSATNAPGWQTIWWLTALTRSFVAVFLLCEILMGRMETAWVTVALVDGLLAGFQWHGLRANWLRYDP